MVTNWLISTHLLKLYILPSIMVNFCQFAGSPNIEANFFTNYFNNSSVATQFTIMQMMKAWTLEWLYDQRWDTGVTFHRSSLTDLDARVEECGFQEKIHGRKCAPALCMAWGEFGGLTGDEITRFHCKWLGQISFGLNMIQFQQFLNLTSVEFDCINICIIQITILKCIILDLTKDNTMCRHLTVIFNWHLQHMHLHLHHASAYSYFCTIQNITKMPHKHKILNTKMPQNLVQKTQKL